MLLNNLKIGWRHMTRNKVFTFINITGLSLGLTCSLFIALWVYDEYQMDAFHEGIDRIYTVTSVEYSGNESYYSFDTPGLLGEELPKVFPEVEFATSWAWTGWHTLAVGDKMTKVPGNYGNGDYFKIFSYPLVLGNRQTALDTKESVAISRSLANRLFGSAETAIGKGIRFENYLDLKVTAVFEDLGSNVSEPFDYLMSWKLFMEREPWTKDWHNSGPTTYIKLAEHADVNNLVPKLKTFLKGYDKNYSNLDRLELGLQPYRDKYLYTLFQDGHPASGRIAYVRLFSAVALFTLIIACINFMNLSTARSINRSKEIGVRKVAGALRISLIGQFLMEAFLFTLVAIGLSILIIVLLMPQFNLLTGKDIALPFAISAFWIFISAVLVITALLAGSYPAFLLSSFKPINVLKGRFSSDSASGPIRKGLVVVQFTLCISFVMAMLVVSRQVDYIQTKNIGYNRNNLLYLPINGYLTDHFSTFKHEVEKMPGITAVTSMSGRPIEMENTTAGIEWEGKDPNSRPTFTQAAVGYDFTRSMQATIVNGRDFSEAHADSANYLINETAAKTIGFRDPVGRTITFWDVKGTIIGVVKDFHFNSLHVPIRPLILRLAERTWGYALIRTEPGQTHRAVEELEAWWKKYNPEFPFAHQFADEEYAAMYRSESVVQSLTRYFALLSTFISCLGLLGLVMFTAEQRTREIGIRKVLGATVGQIVGLLSRELALLIIIAIVLALPPAYYLMNRWLGSFEYHTMLTWTMPLMSALGAIGVAVLTMTLQSLKAARANPAESLKE